VAPNREVFFANQSNFSNPFAIDWARKKLLLQFWFKNHLDLVKVYNQLIIRGLSKIA
jgi:hypothetical protein